MKGLLATHKSCIPGAPHVTHKQLFPNRPVSRAYKEMTSASPSLSMSEKLVVLLPLTRMLLEKTLGKPLEAPPTLGPCRGQYEVHIGLCF